MATPEQRKELLDVVHALLSEIVETDPDSLARTDDLSPDINFEDAVPLFQEMIDLCKQLNQRDISRLASQQLNAIKGACSVVKKHIKAVQEFTLNQNTPLDVCNGLIQEIANSYDHVMNPLLVPLAFTATQATDYARIEREAKGYLTTVKEEMNKLDRFIADAQKKSSDALAVIQRQAAEGGVSTNAGIFLDDAKAHGASAESWRTATIWSAVGTFVAACFSLGVVFWWQPENTAATIQYVVAKLIVLSTLSFVVFWCARNYKSQKHNETLNKHRANALMTFRSFVEGTSDDRVKDAILLQASQAAFTSRPTGFDSPDKDAQTINPVVEIIGKSIPTVPDASG